MAKKARTTRTKKGRIVRQTRRICNLVPSRDTGKDWTFEAAVRSTAVTAVAAPPASKDLRAAWWTIGDQGSTGSCVGWSSTDGVMRYHLVKAGKIGQKDLL